MATNIGNWLPDVNGVEKQGAEEQSGDHSPSPNLNFRLQPHICCIQLLLQVLHLNISQKFVQRKQSINITSPYQLPSSVCNILEYILSIKSRISDSSVDIQPEFLISWSRPALLLRHRKILLDIMICLGHWTTNPRCDPCQLCLNFLLGCVGLRLEARPDQSIACLSRWILTWGKLQINKCMQ